MKSHAGSSRITVVAPFYNEEPGLLDFYHQLRSELEKLGLEYDLVFVDDGSTDRTLEMLNALADEDPRITVLSLARNFGHQVALTAGLDAATGDAVITMDSDLQHPPQLLPQMVAEFEKGVDIVYAVRENTRRLNYLKRITTGAYYALLERVANVRMVRGAADFRLMSRRCVAALQQMREPHRYVRGMVPWLGFPHAVVRYKEPPRPTGDSKYTIAKSLRLAQYGLFSFSTVPLRLVTWLGVLLTSLGVVYFLYTLVVLMLGRTVTGWASVVVWVLVIGGVQLISLGVLAQYIGMIFEQGRHRPLYVLKQQRASGSVSEQEAAGLSGHLTNLPSPDQK